MHKRAGYYGRRSGNTDDPRVLDAIEFIKSIHGVLRVEHVKGDVFSSLMEEEGHITTAGDMEYENRCLRECGKRDAVLCVFCNGEFKNEHDDFTMIMTDHEGNISGSDVPKCLLEEYRQREDLVWLSDSFVIYSLSRQESSTKMVVLPTKFNAMDNIDGTADALFFYPSVSSDVMLKEKFLMDVGSEVATMIVAFDVRRSGSKHS